MPHRPDQPSAPSPLTPTFHRSRLTSPERRSDFPQGKGYSSAAIVEWKPSLSGVVSGRTKKRSLRSPDACMIARPDTGFLDRSPFDKGEVSGRVHQRGRSSDVRRMAEVSGCRHIDGGGASDVAGHFRGREPMQCGESQGRTDESPAGPRRI
jgi:hypothetical protein